MKSVRVVDRSEFWPRPDDPGRRNRSSPDDPFDPRPGRPNILDRYKHYWDGPGWEQAVKEAQALLGKGWDKPRIAQQLGWTVEVLEDALVGKKPCAEMPPPCSCLVNGRRTCVCGASRNGKGALSRSSRFPPPDPKLLKKAKHLYEVKVMTVPEVAKELKLSKGRTYLILIRAGTKFRRRGRRRRES